MNDLEIIEKNLPQFVSNDAKRGRKVLSTIEDELLHCDAFWMSVAFITQSGITPLLPLFKELEQRGVQGKILTTDYLAFSEPRALSKLTAFSNLQLKISMVEDAGRGFHTKGYIFKKGNTYKALVGSSNLTQNALTVNREWNTKIVTQENSEYLSDLFDEFNAIWFHQSTVFYSSIKDLYQSLYRKNQTWKQETPIVQNETLRPNSMQEEVIHSLSALIEQGKSKVLLISATGTGKTYASAFALREQHPKKVLFLVHREQIAMQALDTYKKVFGEKYSYGLLSGSHKDQNCDFLFSTMQMMAKEEIFQTFSKDNFDCIVVDEAHRTGSKSYQKIMQYFQPKLWFGMTASPERMDDFDVYAAFDHNIVYEIRLQQALEEDLLCPFHYFGISDFRIDGQEMDLEDFRYCTSEQRVKYILQQAQFYGYSGDRVKGLMFCSTKEEAHKLSEMMNEMGLKTMALSGDDSQEKRKEAIEKLVSDQGDHLDYILTVDIFNEGVDIPEINQVLLLRKTESPIVFVQQLGRGLRKAKGKEYVVVLDFIGNYKNNYMIPIALSGDQSYNKDSIRRYVLEGERVIPGASTIHFDAIAKKAIFAAIDAANFTEIRLIKENYKNLKNKLGRIPYLMDFDEYGQMDVCRMFENKSLQTYYRFLVKYEKEYTVRITDLQETYLKFVSTKLAEGKRIHELLFLQILVEQEENLLTSFEKAMQEQYGMQLSDLEKESVIRVLTNAFPSSAAIKTFKDCLFIEKDGEDYRISPVFKEQLESEDFKALFKECLAFGISRYQKNYTQHYAETNLVLYQKYTYEDVCRLLNWQKNEVPLNIGGYKYDTYTKTFPVFINYEKAQNIQDTIKYEDRFLDENHLIAISKNKRNLESEDVCNFLNADKRNIQVHLFVRKNKEDEGSKEFYYLGHMKTDPSKAEEINVANRKAVEIYWELDQPVREDLYQYITNG